MNSNLLYPTVTLNNGVKMPKLGLGTWLAKSDQSAHSVRFALRHGYDHIDTAKNYDNERQVGRGWKASIRRREEFFITTKVNNHNQGYTL